RVEARVERATSEDGRVLLPGGTVLKGHVLDAHSSGRVSGKGRVIVAFDQIVVRGRTQKLDTTEIEAVAGDSHERDAAIIGGGTAARVRAGARTARPPGGGAGGSRDTRPGRCRPRSPGGPCPAVARRGSRPSARWSDS